MEVHVDLAKVLEVAEVGIHGVNGMLSQGWVLVGFVERQYSVSTTRSTKSEAVYILGKPRPKRVNPPPSESEMRDLLTHITDPRHPDHKLVRSIIGEVGWKKLWVGNPALQEDEGGEFNAIPDSQGNHHIER